MKYYLKHSRLHHCALIILAALLPVFAHAGLGIPRAEVCHAPSAAKTVAMNRIWDTTCGSWGRFAGEVCTRSNPFPNFDELMDFCVWCEFDNTCEEYWGDPHILSSDGLRYDFQMTGDFALIENDLLRMQIRLDGNGRVSYVRGVALEAGDDSIVIDYSQDDSDTPYVTLNGEAITFENGDWYDLSNEGDFIQRLGKGYRVRIAGLVSFGIRRDYLRLNLDDSLDDRLNGMLGSGDGDPTNDLRTASGDTIDPSDRSETGPLYTTFATDWAREGEASMFPVALPAQVPFEGEANLADIDAATLDSARLECINAGVRPEHGLEECIYDVAVTGDLSLIQGAFSLSPAIADSISSAALSTSNLTTFELADVDSVSSDVPSVGAGQLDQSDNVDEYTFDIPAGETRFLLVGQPCVTNATVKATLLSEETILREVSFGCDDLIELSSEIDALRIFSAYGLSVDYAFDLVAPQIESLGTIDAGQVVRGSIPGGEMARGTLSLDPGTLVYARSHTKDACGGDGRWKIVDSTGAAISNEALLCEDLGLVRLDGDEPFQLSVTGVADIEDYELQVVVPDAPVAALSAPATVQAGSQLTVQWSGPAYEGDYISIASLPNQTAGGQYEVFAYAVEGESEVSLTVPGLPGDYELRYVLSDDRQIIASQPLTVTDATANLTASATAESGSQLAVQWSGPANEGDYISIASLPDQTAGGQYEVFAYAVDGESEVSLTVPGLPGDYELRYVLSSDRQIIASQPLTVTDATASVSASATAEAGSQLVVQWSGPANDGDYISIASLPDQTAGGQYVEWAYVVEGESQVTLTVPGIPGDYELRYVLTSDREIIARQSLTVTEASATVTALSVVDAGSQLTVQWSGPANENDYISIARLPDQDRGSQYEDWAYVADGESEVTLTVPGIPGEYEVRYVLSSDRQIIARQAVQVAPVSATLSAPASVTVGADFMVTWSGPGNDGDYITIAVPEETQGGSYEDFAYATETPVTLTAPDVAGTYEIRYILDSDNQIIEAITIQVVN